MGETAKKILRRRLLEARREFLGRHPEAGDMVGGAVAVWLAARPWITTVGVYIPVRSEPDILPALFSWRGACSGRTLALPAVADGTMGYLEWVDGCEMTRDDCGIRIPSSGRPCLPMLLLVPCVGFTSGGFRVGYGGGYFDRTLAGLSPRPVTMAVGFEVCRADGVFSPEPHDVPLDFVATEKGVAERST